MEIERVLAPNPGPFTGPGTNTYVLRSSGHALVIDPGPVIASHLAAIRHALGRAEPVAVIVTHTHPDHAPAANPLAAEWGVPAIGFAPGPGFEPDDTVSDRDQFVVGEQSIWVVHTPGHTFDHICLLAGDIMFTGDHIMGGSTVVIENATDYMASLEKVRDSRPRHLFPGHGDDMPDAVSAIDAYIAHRIEREDQIVAAVASGASTVGEVVDVVYAGLAETLVAAAIQQVGVQLQKLSAEGRLEFTDGARGGKGTIRLPRTRHD